MRLIMLGAPGAGKGTQAQILAEYLKVPHISTGDLLRVEIQNSTPVGLQAMEYIRAGELVPDSIMIQVLEERLRDPDCSEGFILDGFPRTLSQARYLGTTLRRMKREIDSVVNIDVDQQLILGRLAIRQRTDDDPKTVKHRLDVYHRETAPLIDFYLREGLLRHIDGDAPEDDVTARILRSLD
ncbi:MAG: adenylate kinase [Candidatus Latescibacteria bacterium]|jgi:adenylate kinase|nr:adenylate kinase [Candidatus Latescibacterota bacterium]